ncbi:family 43 glycosylhydrolase [Cellulomonas sp. PhB143]|uniref:family 43 glycosylhydrolase n=1 Tax=Cellulomonas sp. PhB143 TaxID=2485186 RepID=UPI000F472637|nr:family 43 glycosylhydrolase [Cellulomonas sp. PhB143]ROS75403.1 glycosyl hydrolase family 43 [Cellulomonas sp. PhB143]
MRRRRVVQAAAAVLAAGALAVPAVGIAEGAPLPSAPAVTPAVTAAVAAADAPAGTYENPVSAGVVDTFPDPSMIRGKDGRYYAYGTQNPVFDSAGEAGERIVPVLVSDDMAHWQYAGDVFPQGARPGWWPGDSRIWAPDIRYVDGSYHLTYGLSNGGIGLSTAPTPTGPWTDRGAVVAHGSDGGCPSGTIDQAMFTDDDGTRYLYWGSYDVLCVSAMTADATALTGPVTQIAAGRRAEGSFVVRHGDHYYLLYSDAGCCDGEFSGYTVKAGRSTSPLGPFVDPDGVDLMASSSKGGIVLAGNGNGFVGPGHNAVQTDLAGQDWMVYHAIDEKDPNFGLVPGAPGNLSKRPLMIDRLDWIDGWPVVNAGAGASAGPQQAPVTTWDVGSTFDDLTGWDATDASPATEADAGGYVALDGGTVRSRATVDGDVRVQGDVRLADAGSVSIGLDGSGTGADVTASLDAATGELVVQGSGGAARAPLPAGFSATWATLSVEVRGGEVTASLAEDAAGEPLATVTTSSAGAVDGAAVVASSTGAADVDNLGAAALSTPVTERVPDPRVGELLPAYSDDFDGSGRPETGDPAWRWVRGGASQATLTGGRLSWPTQGAELYRTDNSASVLLRDAPEGDFVVETKLDLPAQSANRQAGLLLYANDDSFVKLVHSVLPLSRINRSAQVTEFTKEAPRPTTVPATAVFSGPMFGPAPADTMWMRLKYHHDVENGEHEARMATSTDGSTWTWGGTWTWPDGQPVQIGLVSMNTAGATARFDYVHTYAVADPVPDPQVEVTAQARCVGSSAVLAVRALNTGDAPAGVAIATPFGSKPVAQVAPGRSAYQSFAVRKGTVPAGEATVTVTRQGGEPQPVVAAYDAVSCT